MMPAPQTPSDACLRGVRATRAYIDLDAVAGNVRAIRRSLRPATRVMAVVKANAYGHGASRVAAAALDAGAELLGVATVGEGRALRATGIAAPIVLLGAIDPDEVTEALRLGLDVTVAEATLLEAVQEAARRIQLQEPVRIHLKVDTGLRRYGSPPEQARVLSMRIAGDPYLSLAGVCTHFASADEPAESFTDQQLERFVAAVEGTVRDGGRLPDRHVANSAGILTGRGCDYEIVRLGIALYGVAPSPEVGLLPGMRPVMRIGSRIARVFALEPGDTVGYNRTFRADRRLRCALVPIGYADGYRRSFSNRSRVGLHGRRARVIGRVSMDQIVIGLPDDVEAKVGDRVEILGGDGADGGPAIDELASIADTNAYEILVGIRERIPRVYLRAGEIVAVGDGSGQ
jgi:alanine racemase